MHHVDSDTMPLEPIKRVSRSLRNIFNACAVIGGLVGGGVSIGYFIGVQQQKKDSLAEIDRLMHVWGIRIDRASAAVEDAATAASNAAEAVGEVAGRVDAAADKADKAAKAAVVQAAKVAKSAPPAPPAAVQPEVVNREIRKANEKLKERGAK